MDKYMNSTEAKILHDYYDGASDVHNPYMDGTEGSKSETDGTTRRDTHHSFDVGRLPDNFEYVSSHVSCLHRGRMNMTTIHTFVLNNIESGKTYKVLIHRQRHHKCVVKSIDEVILVKLFCG